MGAGKIKPVWFVSTDLPCRERIMVKEICYTWQYLEGMAKVRCYEVSDGVNAYKLELNTSDFTWRLGVAEQTCL
jgi:hypothetical protein